LTHRTRQNKPISDHYLTVNACASSFALASAAVGKISSCCKLATYSVIAVITAECVAIAASTSFCFPAALQPQSNKTKSNLLISQLTEIIAQLYVEVSPTALHFAVKLTPAEIEETNGAPTPAVPEIVPGANTIVMPVTDAAVVATTTPEVPLHVNVPAVAAAPPPFTVIFFPQPRELGYRRSCYHSQDRRWPLRSSE